MAGALVLTLTALAYPTMLGVQNAGNDQARIVTNTRYGPLTEQDRDFVVKVRAAGLWEHPLGLMAMERGTTPEMREAGEHLVVGHSRLDATCRRIAPELGITLPNLASPQQQQFVSTVDGTRGKQFDTTAVNIMRITHGQIFPAIAKIRANTKNSLVRQLADQANDTVLDHITVLEKTGLVNFDQVNFQQTAPPSLPKVQLTPPAPQPGEPVLSLTAPPGLEVNTSAPSPSPTVR
ncbi:secreted protein [Streptomyces sp. KO7888]|nr:secreted protein [Streptomyces sp. OM5714]NHI11134.1 secreted protein [Streptomyces sp. KO7888]